MHALAPLLWLASAAGCSDGLPNDGAVVEYEHVSREVDVRLEGAAALVTLVDRLRPEPGAAAERRYRVELPEGGAAVVDAWLTSASGRVSSALVGQRDAAGRMSAFAESVVAGALSDEGEERPSRSSPQAALLVARSQEGASVWVTGPCGLGEVRVHLRLRVATEPHEGAWRVPLPLTPDGPALRARVDGRSVALDDEDMAVRVPRVAKAPSGRVATAPLPGAAAEHLVRAELDLPARLRPERPLAFVFVVDRSVSFGAARATASLRFVEQVLAEAPRGSVYALVTFARRPRVDVPSWKSAKDLAPLRRAREGLQVENGSDLLAAVEAAKRVATAAGAREPRVLVLSDLERPSSPALDEVLLGLARPPALTHVVQVFDGPHLWWERAGAQEVELTMGAEATGGVLVRGSLLRGEHDELARYLVRPTRLERPRLVATRAGERVLWSIREGERPHEADLRVPRLFLDGWGFVDTHEPLDALAESGGARLTGRFTPLVAPEELSWHVEGLLWSAPARYPLTPAPATARLLPALTAAYELGGQLDDDAVRALSMESGAVSRLTSRLGLPTWRPPTANEGYGVTCDCREPHFLRGRGGGGSGLGTEKKPTGPFDRTKELAAWLRRSQARCGASSEALRVEVESREILAIEPSGAFGPVERCYREALWGLRLDEDKGVTADAYVERSTVVVPLPSGA